MAVLPSDCSICHEPATEELVALPCGHVFHQTCFLVMRCTWRAECPTCRLQVGYKNPMALHWSCETGSEWGMSDLRDENMTLKFERRCLGWRLSSAGGDVQACSFRVRELERDIAAVADIVHTQAKRVSSLDQARADAEGYSRVHRERLMILLRENNAIAKTTRVQARRLEALEKENITLAKIANAQAEFLRSHTDEKVKMVEAERKQAARVQILERERTTARKVARDQTVLLGARERGNASAPQPAKARGIQLPVVRGKQAAPVEAAEAEGVRLRSRKRQAVEVAQAGVETLQQASLKRLGKSAAGGTKIRRTIEIVEVAKQQRRRC